MLQLSHAAIYLGSLKSDFSRVQHDITSKLFNTLSFHLCLPKLSVTVAQGEGKNPNQINKSFITFTYLLQCFFYPFNESEKNVASMR